MNKSVIYGTTNIKSKKTTDILKNICGLISKNMQICNYLLRYILLSLYNFLK
jgi:hypothetical protein